MSKQEFVKVKTKVPKETDEWFREKYKNAERHYQWELLDSLRATMETEKFLSKGGKEAYQALLKAIADLEQ